MNTPSQIKSGDIVFIDHNRYLVRWDVIGQHYTLLPLFTKGRAATMDTVPDVQ